MSEPNAPEPTMEEILASIRRIISEDEPPPAAGAPEEEPEPEIRPAAPPPPIVEHEDVLELTDPMHEPASPLETIGDLDIMPAHVPAAPTPQPALAAAPPPRAVYESPFEDEPLVGESAADSAASAFGHLAQHLVIEGRTLEDVVRELLRPLLKTWLDTHLPGIVQAKVDEEVARIARRRP